MILLAANLVIQLLPREPDRWEYLIHAPMDVVLEDDLKKLGLDGWELVSARRATTQYADHAKYEMIFRRKVSRK